MHMSRIRVLRVLRVSVLGLSSVNVSLIDKLVVLPVFEMGKTAGWFE